MERRGNYGGRGTRGRPNRPPPKAQRQIDRRRAQFKANPRPYDASKENLPGRRTGGFIQGSPEALQAEATRAKVGQMIDAGRLRNERNDPALKYPNAKPLPPIGSVPQYETRVERSGWKRRKVSEEAAEKAALEAIAQRGGITSDEDERSVRYPSPPDDEPTIPFRPDRGPPPPPASGAVSA